MNEPPEITAEIRRWVEKAEHDLRTAEYVLALGESYPSGAVYFQ